MTPAETFKPSWRNFFYCLFRSPSMGAVIAANVLVLLVIPLNKQNAHNLLWVYWSQSVLIGLLHFLKMLVYTFPRKQSGEPNDISTWPKTGAAVFFLFHYGFFHFVYMFFLGLGGVDWELVGKAVSIFGGHMFLASIFHYRDENNGKQDLGEFMFKPYLRILPIHMAIIVGGIVGSVAIFLVLMVLKTAMETFSEYMDINKASVTTWFKEMNDKYKAKEKAGGNN